MSVAHRETGTSGVRDPPGEVAVSDDGRRVRAVWRPFRGVKRTALFRVEIDERYAILQHVREVVVRRLGATTSDLDADATLADVPDARLATIRERGFTLAEEEGP